MSEEAKCCKCGITDTESLLIAVRFKGRDTYVCPKEMPKIIHG